MEHLSFLHELDENHKRIISIASLFDHDFTIDWIQMLTNSKATEILRILDHFTRQGILKKIDVGSFNMVNEKIKKQLRQSLPADSRNTLHKKISDILINETVDKDKGIISAAEQLLYVKNNLEGCQILCKAGDHYRRSGNSKKAMIFYNKSLDDLNKTKGKESDLLFIKTMISFSKDHMASSRPQNIVSCLSQALGRAERLKDPSLRSLVLLHLASNEYMSGDFAQAYEHYVMGKTIAEEAKDPALDRTLITSSVIHNTYTGQFREAVRSYEYFKHAFATSTRFSARVELSLALSCSIMGHLSQSLGILEKIRVESHHNCDTVVETHTISQIAIVFMLMNDFSNAILKLNEALKLKQPSDLFTECLASIILAYCYYRKNDINNSYRCLMMSLELRNRYAYHFPEILLELCMAIERGNYPAVSGLSFDAELRKALEMENKFSRGVALRYVAIKQIYENAPDELILQNLKKSAELLEASGAQKQLAETKFELARYYLRQGNKTDAKQLVADATSLLHLYGDKTIPSDLNPLVNNIQIKKDIDQEILKFCSEVNVLQDSKDILQHILTTINKITGAERGCIFLKNEVEHDSFPFDLLIGNNLSPDDLKSPAFADSRNLIRKTFQTGQFSISERNDRSRNGETENETVISSICVPLMLKNHTIGVLYHDNRLFPATIRKKDLQTLSYFSTLAAIAIENTQAFEEINNLKQKIQDEKQYLEEQQIKIIQQEGIIAESKITKKVFTSAQQVAKTESTVLILGETGVGKEMVARAIHQNSSRCENPFVKVNCGALPESLVASELFGHEKGAFTGAVERRIGRFEMAHGGTLFLDEIGDISLDVQVRLLRVLQTKEFERLGGLKTIQSDFRLIAATNRNLEEDVVSGRFRADLFYRLNVFPIYVPPLRERPEDIESLATSFLKIYADRMRKSFKGIPEQEMKKLQSYHWPGNIRELKNVIERGVILSPGGLFHVPDILKEAEKAMASAMTLEEMERKFIIQTLQKTGWKIYGTGGAANMLGLNYSTLYSRMKKLKIKKPAGL